MTSAIPLSFVYRQSVFANVRGFVRLSMAIAASTLALSRFVTALTAATTPSRRLQSDVMPSRTDVRPESDAFQSP